MSLIITAILTIVILYIGVPVLLFVARVLGLYAIVEERTYRVYTLFGKVVGTIDQPGLHFLPSEIGLAALGISFFGKCYVLDMRLDQEYRRSEAVNSEEGAPMGIGIWHEMFISDPVAYMFKNTDPRGSLSATSCRSSVRRRVFVAHDRPAGLAPELA